MASYFELKQKISKSGTQTAGSTGTTKSSYFDLKKKVLPVIESSVARLTAENDRKRKEEQIKKSQEEAQRYQSEAGTGALIGNTLKGINPFSIQGLKNIGQGIANVGSAIVNPIDTAKKIGGAVKDLATSSAQETAYDVFYQKGLDEQNLRTIQENNKKVLGLNEAIKNTQDEAEKEKLKRHAKIYLEFNQRLAEETGGELKDKTNLQLAGQALGTALDLTPFLGFGSLGTKAGLKTLEKVGVKSAGKVLGRTLPKTGRELTKEAVAEGGLYGGLSGFGAGIEQKDPTIKSVGLSTAIGTGLGAGGGGVLSTIFSRLGSKAPRLKKAIDEGKIDESEIEKIFEEDGIAGVEEVIKPEPRKLKAGEFAPISKEIQETTGKKLTAKETLEVKDKIEQGYTKEEIIDEILNPRRTEPTPKEVEMLEDIYRSRDKEELSGYLKKLNETETAGKISMEFDNAEAGERIITGSLSEGGQFIGIKSSFPKWIPEHLRRRKLLDVVQNNLNEGTVPKGTLQRELYDIVVERIAKEEGLNVNAVKNTIDRFESIKTTPKRTKLTSKPVKTESKVQVPDERQEALDYVKSKSVKFREPTAAGDNIIRHARELSEYMQNMKERGISEKSYEFKRVNKEYEKALDEAQKERTKYRLADEGDDLVSQAQKMKLEGKSFDDFVKAQGEQMYRSSASPFDVAKMGEDGIFLSPDKKFVHSWQKSQGYRNFEEFSISPKANILRRKDFPKKFVREEDGFNFTSLDDQADIIKYAKDNGFDGIEDYSILPDGKKIEHEFAIWNKDVIKTKSQLTDIWNKEQEKFRVKDDLAKVGIKITDDQEQQIIKLNKSMFGDENIKITEQILTPQGQKALGSYRDGVIKIIKGQADIKDTYYHESFHKYLDVLTTADEQADLLIEARKVSGLKDFGEVEEWLSEKFIGYAKNREGVTGKIKAQFDNVLERIKTYLGNEDKIKKAYSELISGKATKKVTSTTAPPTKTIAKKGESITAKKLNERFKDNKKLSTEYDVIEINKKLDEASRKLQENPEKTISEAFTDGGSNVDKVATLTELFEKSINDGDDFMQNQAFNRLKQLAPETAQTMNMFKALTETNPHFSYMSSVVDEKLKNLILKSSSLRKATKGMKPSEALNKAKKLAKNKIAKDIMRTKSKITIKKAQDLLDSLICK